jgi:hypothetical protein
MGFSVKFRGMLFSVFLSMLTVVGYLALMAKSIFNLTNLVCRGIRKGCSKTPNPMNVKEAEPCLHSIFKSFSQIHTRTSSEFGWLD